MRILITDGMAKEGLDILGSNPDFQVDCRKATSKDELLGLIGNVQCVVIRSATQLTRDVLEKAAQMKLIARAGAGVDNVDVTYATERKIPVMNAASANSLAAAELTMGLMFSVLRQIPQAALSLKEGRWDREKFKGYELSGRTLGVIGLGNIGRLVAERAVALGMRVVGFDPTVQSLSQVPSLQRFGESVAIKTTLDAVLPLVDVLTLHIPKTKQTANIINEAALEKMKKGSFLFNCARGGLVDEQAVIKALDSGKLLGAGFDVFDKEPPQFPHPLFTHPKVVCVPHIGASTFEAQERVGSLTAKQIVGFFTKGEKAGVINL